MNFNQIAQDILLTVQKSKRILLSCHSRADFDSVGSVLSLGEVLEKMGKEVTMIAGDTPPPKFATFFPGSEKILPQNFFQTDLSQIDLFIVTDMASTLSRVSELGEVKLPPHLTTIVIDHHVSSGSFSRLNLTITEASATGEILFDLFKNWQVAISPDVALNLLLALYGDTGSFCYPSTSSHTFLIASELIKLAPDYFKVIDELENNEGFERLLFRAVGVIKAERFFGGKLIISAIGPEDLKDHSISGEEANNSGLSGLLRSVAGCEVAVVLREEAPGKVKFSGRSRHPETYDVFRLASFFGGGGHRAASGAMIVGKGLAEAKAAVVEWCQNNFDIDK